MKRLLIGLILSLLPLAAFPAAKTTQDANCRNAVNSQGYCLWSDTATWDGAALPVAGDTVTIAAGNVVVYDRGGGTAISLGTGVAATVPLVINGTLIFDESSTNRDADGFRDMTLKSPNGAAFANNVFTIGSAGKWILRAGARLNADTTAAIQHGFITNGGVLDVQGQVTLTTIAMVEPKANDTALCGTPAGGATEFRRLRIFPRTDLDKAKKYRRIRFMSGALRNREFEIAALGANTSPATAYFDVCLKLPPLSGTCPVTPVAANSAGECLTPHSTVGVFPAATPSANSRHSAPALQPNSACTAVAAPEQYCTGAGTGNGVEMFATPGDQIAIIDDVWIRQSAGTNGFDIVTGINPGANPTPVVRAANIYGLGSIGVTNVNRTLQFAAATTTQTAQPFDFLNVHDMGGTDVLEVRGIKNPVVQYSSFHDAKADSTIGPDGPVVIRSSQTSGGDPIETPTNHVTITDNTCYRERGNCFNINAQAASETQGTLGCIMDRNLSFEGCTQDGECACQEIVDCQPDTGTNPFPAHANNNVCYGMRGAAAGTKGDGIHFNGSVGPGQPGLRSDDGSLSNNWVTNVWEQGISTSAGSAFLGGGENIGITNSYIAFTGGNGGSGGKYFSTVIRDVGMSASGAAFGCLRNPMQAMGVFCIDSDTAVAASTQCGGVGCGGMGIIWDQPSTGWNNNHVSVVARDLVLGFPDSPSPGKFGIASQATMTHGGLVDHVTVDGDGVGNEGFALNGGGAGVSWTLADSISTHGADSNCMRCSAAHPTLVNNLWCNRPIPSADRSFPDPTNCTMNPAAKVDFVQGFGYKGRGRLFNYNFNDYALGLTAGTSPAGSPQGIRAFSFNRAAITALWSSTTDPNQFCTGAGTPTSMAAYCTGAATGFAPRTGLAFDGVFPADIANVDNTDSDGDGVLDLHDDCVYNYDPSQYDADGDGKGNACDATP